ncbi:MAG: tetratricopeptide repeat protein [Gemmataceae bacterium]
MTDLSPLDTPGQLQAAQDASIQGNYAGVIQHLANVLSVAPLQPDALTMLDRLVANCPDPLSLVELSGETLFGLAAIRAYVLGRVGNTSEAVALLGHLVVANQGSGVTDYALPWIEAGQLSEQETYTTVCLFLASLHPRFGGDIANDPDDIAAIERWEPFVRERWEHLCENEHTRMGVGVFLRKLNRIDEAVELAERSFQEKPGVNSAIMLANAYRVKDDQEMWYQFNLKALEFDPNNVGVMLDLGDGLWDRHQNLEEAEHWYSEALKRDRQNEWALPSVYSLQYLRTQEFQWRLQLEHYVMAHPDNGRGRETLYRIAPFLGTLVYPGDASLQNHDELVKDIADQPPGEVTGTITQTLTGIQAPSIQVGFDLQFKTIWKQPIEVKSEVVGLQTPDPRQPRKPVIYRLWEYEGNTPRRVVTPPSEEVARFISTLASEPYDLQRWLHAAHEVAMQLGPDQIQELLGVMVHPPLPTSPISAWYWMFRVQVAAALVVAKMRREEWSKSPVRNVLIDLANGPMDWTNVAAVVGLMVSANDDPVAEEEVGPLFDELLQDVPKPGEIWYACSIVNCHLRLPRLSNDKRMELLDVLHSYDNDGQEVEDALTMGCRQFIEKDPPPEVGDDMVARGIIAAYSLGQHKEYEAYGMMLKTVLMLAEGEADAATGNASLYHKEKLMLLRGIQQRLG